MSKKKNNYIIDKSYKELLDDESKVDIKKSNKTSKAFDWLIEFSKKVVFVTFIVYLISTLVEIYIMNISANITGEIVGIDTFIAETNATFRIVVGSYCIKAALENVFKIGLDKYLNITKIKNKILNHSVSEETGVNCDDINTDVIDYNNSSSEIFESGEDCTSGYSDDGVEEIEG